MAKSLYLSSMHRKTVDVTNAAAPWYLCAYFNNSDATASSGTPTVTGKISLTPAGL